jgi:hypothetical protein
MLRATQLAAALILCFGGAHALAVEPAEKTPAQLAAETLDSFRDAVHKEKMRIVWPAEAAEALPPPGAEVFLIHGYINYAVTRLTWKDGTVQAERVRTNRTWFYNAKGESFEAERFDVPAPEFLRAWKALGRLLGAKAEPLAPPPPPETQTDAEGNLTFHAFGSVSTRSSSHAAYVWVRVTCGTGQPPLYRRVVRQQTFREKIEDFDELRNRAISRLFEALLPEGRNAPKGRVFDLAEWAPFLTAEIGAATERIPAELPKSGNEEDHLLLEASLRILGETGHAAALPILKALEAKLAHATESGTYGAWCVRREAGFAATKIHFLTQWNPAEAMDAIRGNVRRWHADNDLAKWIRARFLERDPEGYQKELLDDLAQRAQDADLTRETIAELAQHYPGQCQDELRRLLKHAEPEIAADAAFALLKTQRGAADAVATLERLAGDRRTPIGPYANWFDGFARARALAYLRSTEAPPESRWSAARVRQQLAQPDEDGRMLHHLFSALDILQDPATPEEKLRAYRRVLEGRRNKGILVACQALIELKDRDRAPLIGRVLDELAAGCNQHLSWQEDPDAKYPWTDKYELDEVRKTLAKMTEVVP